MVVVFLAMIFRSHLRTPTSLKLPSGTTVDVPTCLVDFKAWTRKDKNGRAIKLDSSVISTWNKEVLDHQGEPVFAELAILRVLTADGWDGRWVTPHKFRTGLLDQPQCELPPEQDALFRRIATAKGSLRGCWDVFAWRESAVLFVEAKRNKKDKISQDQKEWLEAAMKVGVSLAHFLIVEWDVVVERVD